MLRDSRLFILTALIVSALTCANAQTDYAGLWAVDRVLFGQEFVTPVAKWFQINEDGTVTGGNGGLININGTWSEVKESHALFIDQYGVEDPMGPFKVEIAGDTASWSRLEEGTLVTVVLYRAESLPDAPWDMCVGSWNLADDEAEESLFMSWDRTFRSSTKSGNQSGVWHIAAHNPRLTLYTRDGQTSIWTIEFPDKMTMTWSSDFGDSRTYKRSLD